MNKVSVIIIHWNTPDLLKKLLINLKANENTQIIVIDNHSEKPLDWLKESFPTADLVLDKSNSGYATACNQGMKKSRSEWLLFLNPDVGITSQQLNKMVNFAVKNKLDALSPLPETNNYRKPLPTVWSLLVEFTPLNRFFSLENLYPKTLFGGCLLIRSSVLKKLGGWDEDFFLWFEDSDLTLRLFEKNYQVGWAPVKINHVGGASFKKLNDKQRRKLFFGSMSIYAKKHFSLIGRLFVALLKFRYSF